MLKNSSSQESLGQIQPKLVGYMLEGPIKGQNKEQFDNLKRIFSWTTSRNALIFGMEHPWEKEIQVCSYEVISDMYGPTPGAQIFT